MIKWKNIKPFTKKAEAYLKNHIEYLFQNFVLLDDKSVCYNMMLDIEHHKMDIKKTKIAEVLK